MTVAINIKADVKAAIRQLNRTQRIVVPRAAARAINRTAQQAERTGLQHVAAEMGIAQKRVKRGVKRTKASKSRLVATIAATGRRLNVMSFKGKALKRGGVSAKPWKRLRRYPSGFTISGRRSGKQVAVLREGDRIRSIHGPGIESEFKRAIPEMEKTIRRRWPINFQQDLRFFLSRSK